MDNLDLRSLIARLSPEQARELGKWMQEEKIARPREYAIPALHCWEVESEGTDEGTLILASGPLTAVLGEIASRVSGEDQERIRNKAREIIGEGEKEIEKPGR